jgi:hypothetical protein
MAKGESRVLMVAPPSAAYYQFGGEVRILFNKLKDPPEIYMSEDKNHRDYPDRGVVIVPWSILADAAEALLEWAPGVLLLDESHRASVCRGLWVRAFLTPEKLDEWCLTSSQSGAALALGYATPKATLATATPTSTGRLNWHTQLSILEPRGWGTAMEFGYYFCEGRKAEAWGKQGDGSQAAWAWEANGTSNDEVFFPRVKRLVHTVMTQDMSIPLPPLTFKVVDLGREELNLPANAPGVLPNNKAGTVLHAELCDAAERKTDYIIREVQDLISRGVKKIAVVTGRKEHVNELKKKLSTLGLPIFHYVGSKTAESLKKPMKYQLASEGIFLTTFQAGGESLNLHSTEHVLCSMCPWDTRSLIQLLGRFQRINGVHATFNLIMARGTKDDRIRQVLLPRILEVLELGQDSIVGDIKEGIQVSPEEENKMLSEILLEDTDWR